MKVPTPTPPKARGALLVEQMRAAGVEYLFTNPGSYEVGFFDAFHRPAGHASDHGPA